MQIASNVCECDLGDVEVKDCSSHSRVIFGDSGVVVGMLLILVGSVGLLTVNCFTLQL